jgi:hypothetical protein
MFDAATERIFDSTSLGTFPVSLVHVPPPRHRRQPRPRFAHLRPA